MDREEDKEEERGETGKGKWAQEEVKQEGMKNGRRGS